MKKIAAVIVTFNNADMLANLLKDIRLQTRLPDEVIVVDNASRDRTREMIQRLFPEITYIRLKENQGTAGGYYEGLKAALSRNDFIWTLDDDVRINRDSLENLVQGLEITSRTENVAVVRSVGFPNPDSAPVQMEVYTWRGCLFRSDALRMVGLPKKEFFIYGEDLEHALRLKRAGFSFFWIPSSGCVEARDAKIVNRFLGRSFKIYPDAFRFYYAFRNEIFIYLRYGKSINFVRTILYALKIFIYVIIYKPAGSVRILTAIARGIFEGFSGRLGINERYLPNPNRQS